MTGIGRAKRALMRKKDDRAAASQRSRIHQRPGQPDSAVSGNIRLCQTLQIIPFGQTVWLAQQHGRFALPGNSRRTVNYLPRHPFEVPSRHSPGTLGACFLGAPATFERVTFAFGALLHPNQRRKVVADTRPILRRPPDVLDNRPPDLSLAACVAEGITL
jgi:hypothetical protein